MTNQSQCTSQKSNKLRKFEPEEYANYLKVKPLMQRLYPSLFNSRVPLPIDPVALTLIISDPYLKESDKELADFIDIWCQRREYTLAICMHQVYFDQRGGITSKIPDEVIVDKAYALARVSQRLNFSKQKTNPENIR